MVQRNLQLGRAAGRAMMAAAIGATLAFAAVPANAAKPADIARVEIHIKDMHAILKITPAEEAQWAKVADVMRENAREVSALNEARLERSKTMSAVDDLNSYSEVAQAHAAGARRFAEVFAPLYASMPDVQKAEVDAVFRHGDRKHMDDHRGSHKTSQKAHAEMHQK